MLTLGMGNDGMAGGWAGMRGKKLRLAQFETASG